MLCLLALAGTAFLSTFVWGGAGFAARDAQTRARADLVVRLRLTDPALITESSYARQRSLVDPRAAFQEHPFAFDLFPGGSILPPANHANLDRPSALPR